MSDDLSDTEMGSGDEELANGFVSSTVYPMR